MSEHSTIRLSRAFCSARDRNIPVLVRVPEPYPESSTTEGDPRAEVDVEGAQGERSPELVSCLDYGVRCTGWLCPLFSVPTLPPEELLEEAIAVERRRKARDIAEGRAILERALKEGRAERKRTDRRRASRRRRERERDLTAGSGPAS